MPILYIHIETLDNTCKNIKNDNSTLYQYLFYNYVIFKKYNNFHKP